MDASDGIQVRVYRVRTAKKANATILQELMVSISPHPTPDDIFFVTDDCWATLPSLNKNGFFDMQYYFANNYNALKLHGLNDLSIEIADNSIQAGHTTLPRTVTILQWITNFKASDGQKLFYMVFPGKLNDVEIWYNNRNQQESLAWVKSALTQIARSSFANPETDVAGFEAIFTHPNKVWKAMNANFTGTTLQQSCQSFIDFHLPDYAVLPASAGPRVP